MSAVHRFWPPTDRRLATQSPASLRPYLQSCYGSIIIIILCLFQVMTLSEICASALPILACLLLVVLKRVAREHLRAVLALRRQLRDRLLDRQVPGGEGLGDVHAAVGTRGGLVPQPRVGQQVIEARGAHKVAIATLKLETEFRECIGVMSSIMLGHILTFCN